MLFIDVLTIIVTTGNRPFAHSLRSCSCRFYCVFDTFPSDSIVIASGMFGRRIQNTSEKNFRIAGAVLFPVVCARLLYFMSGHKNTIFPEKHSTLATCRTCCFYFGAFNLMALSVLTSSGILCLVTHARVSAHILYLTKPIGLQQKSLACLELDAMLLQSF